MSSSTSGSVTPSLRLEAIARRVRPGEAAADIGTDHGLLAIALAADGRLPRVYACDLRPEPLSVARANVERHGAAKGVELRLGDGLAPVADVALGTAVIAGMGGTTMEGVLDRGPLELVRRVVVAPNEGLERVRRALHRHGFWPVDEDIVRENDRWYPVVAAERPAPRTCELADVLVGPVLRALASTDPRAAARDAWLRAVLDRYEATLRGLSRAAPDNAAAAAKRDACAARIEVLRAVLAERA